MKKETILAEIRRTAEANGGVALGVDRFTSETGIRQHEWLGKHWARWSDALVEAGFRPNEWNKSQDDSNLLDMLGRAILKLGHIPTQAEMDLARKAEPAFPSSKTLRVRFQGKVGAIRSLFEYCESREEFAPVREQCRAYLDAHPGSEETADGDEAGDDEAEDGYVYLVRSGRFCKIGRSNSAGRREREIALQLPEKAAMKHVIRTDDPVGIEAYWHNRFADKRRNGEWFELSAEDVRAFKRRKFM